MTALRARRASDNAVLVVACDGSREAGRALDEAATIAGPGGHVTVVNVVRVQGVSSRLETVRQDQRDEQWRLLSEAQRRLERQGVRVELVARIGDPVEEILAEARRAAAATIVVGRAPRSPRFHGSLVDKLVRRATSDVLVVH